MHNGGGFNMRTNMSKKYLCLIVVLLFLIPTVAALNIGYDSNPKLEKGMNIDKDLKFPESDITDIRDFDFFVPERLQNKELSLEVQNILQKYDWNELDQELQNFVVKHNKLMLERRANWEQQNSRMPYEPLDVTNKIAKLNSETGEMESFFPDTQLKRTEVEMCDRSNYDPNNPLLSDSPNAKYADPTLGDLSDTTKKPMSTRAPEADVELYQLEWTYVQEGWAEQNEIETSNNEPVPGNQYSYGAFQVGKKTTFTARVRNNDPGAGSVNVYINFSISSMYTQTPMQRNPTSYQRSVGSSPITVSHDFTPPAAGYLLVQCLIEYDNDPDIMNNYIGWQGLPVFIWSADMESSGSNYGWQKLADGSTKQHQASDWATGDNGATNAWHVTNGPANQNAEAHTASNAWFHGEDVGGALVPDTYGDNMNRNIDDNNRNHTYLNTPYVNLGDIVDDERTVMGIDEANRFYLDYMVLWGVLMTGELEIEEEQNQIDYLGTDVLWNGEYNDANNNDWLYAGYPYGITYVVGDYSTLEYYIQTPQAAPHWNPNFHLVPVDQTTAYLYPGYPVRLFISDGTGGVQNSGGARNFTNPGVRFRLDFDGDGEDDQTTQTGIYADDFAVWGIQDYTAEKRVGITEVTYPKTSGVSIIYKDSTASFSVTVRNWGKLYQSLPVKMTVEDSDGNEIGKYTTQKSAGNLPNDEEKEVQFTWMPEEEGDFTIKLEAGDESQDWTPGDNTADFYVHVSPDTSADDVDILVVDDDDSGGQMGMWRINTEDKMLKALIDNDLRYRVYTVEYNETGPSVDIMDDYELVIWMTGLDNEIWSHGGRENYNKNNPAWDITLKSTDMDELESFLSGKDKKLWIISPGFLYDYYGIDYKTIPPGDFAREYMHVLYVDANETVWSNDNTEIVTQGTPNPLEGVPDTVMDEAEYITYDTEPPFGFTDIGGVVDKKDPGDDDTQRLFFQDAAHLSYNSILYKGPDYMTSFFGFNFYLIDDEEDAKDCVYRLLTGFGMTGGVLIELFTNADRVQTVYPSNSTTYQYKITNLGKKTDTMELSVKATYSKNYPTKYKDWSPVFEGDDVVMKGGKPTVTLNGLATKKKIYLKVTAPVADDYSEYPAEGEAVVFKINALSQNTKLENETSSVAKVPTLGRITMESSDDEDSIDVDETAKFLLEIYNETNAEDDVTVELSFSGDGADLAKFVVKNNPTTNKKVTTVLEANTVNDDIQLHISAEEHTLAGWHNVTVTLKDESGGEVYAEIELSVEVKQFYNVECNTTGDENGDKSFVIDPNDYVDEGDDYIVKTFTINTRNWGNGYDNIELYWEENQDSDDTSDWLEPGIYLKKGAGVENITEISVEYYDEDRKDPKYGEEQVFFDVYIPIDIEVGKYMIDFYIESHGTEDAGEADNNVVTFTFKIIKPNLRYTKLNNQSEPNFELYDFDLGEQIIEDPLNEYGDYYIERSYKDFDLLTIEIKVFVLNDGDNEVTISPSDVWLNITYEDEFGITMYELYSNLTPVAPTSELVIAAGQTGEFTFRWDPETIASKEPYEYTFELTVDPDNIIFEKDETDNSATFELWLKHTPKPPKKSGSGGMPGFESALLFAAIAVVLLGLMFTNRRRRH
jgi:hypothetical protein